jgi:hypothetical protein
MYANRLDDIGGALHFLFVRYFDIQQRACEWLVELQPYDNEMLFKLGAVQLARYKCFAETAELTS